MISVCSSFCWELYSQLICHDSFFKSHSLLLYFSFYPIIPSSRPLLAYITDNHAKPNHFFRKIGYIPNFSSQGTAYGFLYEKSSFFQKVFFKETLQKKGCIREAEKIISLFDN